MQALVVLAHPLGSASLCGRLAAAASETLARAGHDVTSLDLYREGFDPRLSQAERRAYYDDAGMPADKSVASHADMLTRADVLVLVFPTWWFGPPAILKGWIDRVFAPGIAFDHAPDFGPLRPRLARLRHTVAVTTLGSPWWIDRLVMRRPVRRVLRTGVMGACAPKAGFTYLPLYSAEAPQEARVAAFEARLRRRLAAL